MRLIAVSDMTSPYLVSRRTHEPNDSLRALELILSTDATDTPWRARKRWLQMA